MSHLGSKTSSIQTDELRSDRSNEEKEIHTSSSPSTKVKSVKNKQAQNRRKGSTKPPPNSKINSKRFSSKLRNDKGGSREGPLESKISQASAGPTLNTSAIYSSAVSLISDDSYSSSYDSSTDLSTNTSIMTGETDSGSYVKPVYLQNSNLGSMVMSRDSLASRAYSMIALKFVGSEDHREPIGKYLGHKEKGDIPDGHRRRHAVSEAGRDADAGIKFNSNVSETGTVAQQRTRLEFFGHRKTTPLVQKIDTYVLNVPQLYDNHIATQVRGRPDVKKSGKSTVSLTGLASASGVLRSVSQPDRPLPVLRSVPSTYSHHAHFSWQKPLTSTTKVSKSIPSRISANDLNSKRLPDLTGATSKEELARAQSDMKIKITTRNSIKRISDDNSRFNYYNANIIPLHKLGDDQNESLKRRAELEAKRKLSKTVETSHVVSVDHVSQERQFFKEECRSAFKHQRIPTLRRSPAYILDRRPLGYSLLPCSNRSSMKGGFGPSFVGSTTVRNTIPHRLYCTSGSMPRGSYSTSGSMPHGSYSTSGSMPRGSYSTSGPMPCGLYYTSGSMPNVYKVMKTRLHQPSQLLEDSWWEKGSFGSLRVDQLGIGSPRFYPWAPYNQQLIDDVRCRVLRWAHLPKLPHKPRKALSFAVYEPDQDEEDKEKSKPTLKMKCKFSKPLRKGAVFKKESTNSVGKLQRRKSERGPEVWSG
ncbi:hypothetical protein ElyMa_004005900 [Elysia marginata]|uniref:Uncharacterized protein n=1 Tax=Elysia marginata TaxID=1093978 RepID=A0AAV4G073_9GAST|nr:hypothetical protein ElyMa_004005900 [Elysia marginata]